MRPALLLFCAALAQGHKFEFSTADIDWIPSKSSVQVVLSLHTDDIEAHLRAVHNRQLEIDRDKDAEALVCAYVLTVFELRQAPLHCIGIKPGLHFTEVYLEASPKDGKPPAYLRNEVLAKQHPSQKNLVNLKRGSRPLGRSVEYTAIGGWKALRWE